MERSAALIGGKSPLDSCVLHVVFCSHNGGRAASYIGAFGCMQEDLLGRRRFAVHGVDDVSEATEKVLD